MLTGISTFLGNYQKLLATPASINKYTGQRPRNAYIGTSTDVYSHIIDDDRRRNAELFEDAFYEKKNLDPQMHEKQATEAVKLPEGVDAEMLAKVLANPEMKALLMSLAETIG